MPSTRFTALADVAARWRDPDHPARASAVQDTLDAPNRWTEQALTHALNRWMQSVTIEGLRNWLGEEMPSASVTVGVLHSDKEPLAGFRQAVATWTLGHSYVGHLSEESPSLIPAFAEEVAEEGVSLQAQFGEEETVYEAADVLLGHPDDSVAAVRNACDEHDIPPERRLIRSPVYSVGVVDGHESEDEMGRLAEDMLLYEGMGRRRLAVLWAPREHPPDKYLEAMARFRGLFPAHPDTPGTLQMQQAFLEARDESHAYADGLEFLMSRGEPAPQRPGHVRWAEYDDLEEVTTWTDKHEGDLYATIARPHLHDKLPDRYHLRSPGGVHVPPLDDEEGRETVSFLRGVGS